ncbi:hypothetical protein, conserved [Eimeria tenella]|uniref:Uncharacterized protein n=1 Tax=Eimeria tenella TaxID=5802 RepID=U6KYX5_EIMTE|nr:hypothetical protein, conserved [Eimeria tenella]CDJ40705.1 hypothetical protein, conserved [Eimeria tenella]|eukprot:XP_013231455.1 hypothetical protein, conserved [Eimeria tenella]
MAGESPESAAAAAAEQQQQQEQQQQEQEQQQHQEQEQQEPEQQEQEQQAQQQQEPAEEEQQKQQQQEQEQSEQQQQHEEQQHEAPQPAQQAQVQQQQQQQQQQQSEAPAQPQQQQQQQLQQQDQQQQQLLLLLQQQERETLTNEQGRIILDEIERRIALCEAATDSELKVWLEGGPLSAARLLLTLRAKRDLVLQQEQQLLSTAAQLRTLESLQELVNPPCLSELEDYKRRMQSLEAKGNALAAAVLKLENKITELAALYNTTMNMVSSVMQEWHLVLSEAEAGTETGPQD